MEGGPLPPSRRRSLFTLSTAMIIFSSKAYNILPLIPHVKAAFLDKSVDPFLQLVDDSKLQAVKTVSICYGSKEDDASALKSLSELVISGDQSWESLASIIVSSLKKSSDCQLLTVKEQLLNEFSPDDVCPLGFVDTPRAIYQFQPDESKTDEASPVFTMEDEAYQDTNDTKAKKNPKQPIETSDLLSVNQLLESVLETAQQVGRLSVTAPDVSFKEMAGYCEALLVGKQQMSCLFNTQQRQEIMLISCSQKTNEERVSHTPDGAFHRAGNPFMGSTDTNRALVGTPLPLMCVTEYLHQRHSSFRLPASSPYDHFLKAAGSC